jgi:hypothetical protein
MSSFSYYDLLDMFEQPGCAVCRILQRDAHKLLDSILYEYVNDPTIQKKFRASRGLCGEHGWQLTQDSNALGTAILYEQSIHEVLTILEMHSSLGGGQGLRRMFSANPQSLLSDALEPTMVCPVCIAIDDAEARYLRLLCDHIGDEKFTETYRTSDGVCLVHFRQMLRMMSDNDDAKSFVTLQSDIFKQLRTELLEFMRKNDFQHVDEDVMTLEATSWRRAISQLAGQRGVFNSRRKRS